MANITALLAALSNLPTVGGAPLTPLPGTVNAPPDFNLPGMLAGPEPPPGAPAAPLDPSIIQKYLALAGPAPTPPPPMARPGILDKIFAVLGGVSAGIQGQGPQYAASLREERLRPQREFEARQQQYEQNRRQLGLAGLREAESAEERRQARETATADRRFQMDYKRYERELDLKDDREKMLLQDMLLSRRQREDDERQFARQQAAERARKEQQAAQFTKAYRLARAKDSIARELGEYDAGLRTELSPAAAKWESVQAKLAEVRMARLARIGSGGGGGSSAAAQKALAQFESVKQQVADAAARGDATTEMQLRRQMNAAFNRLARFPGQFDLSYDESGQWPTARPRTGGAPQPTTPQPTAAPYQSMGIFPSMMPPAQQQAAPAPATGGKTITMDQLKAAARQAGISVDAAVKQFREAGYSMRP